MSTVERQLRDSLADIDADVLAGFRAALDAVSLTDPPATVAVDRNAALTVARLAGYALRDRAAAPAAQIGPRGKLVALIAGDDRGRLIAEVEFDDEDDLTRVGALIAASVVIEPAMPELKPANEQRPGEGSPPNLEEDDDR